ncbi:Sec1 family-domain-containing protein [Melanogaster broomeanus]|nr:Sec1 family-domain-containing protein [Melanogaster broomeanus]
MSLCSIEGELDHNDTVTYQVIALGPPRFQPSTVPPVWNVLVLDHQTKDVLAAVLRVQNLRDVGLTLHVQLHSLRPPLPDVPAVYFVIPTPANTWWIAEDLDKCLYEPTPSTLILSSLYLVHCSKNSQFLSRARRDTHQLTRHIRSLTSFIAPSPSLFPLFYNTNTNTRIPSRSITAQTALSIQTSKLPVFDRTADEIERIANELFSAVVTTGVYSASTEIVDPGAFVGLLQDLGKRSS